MLKYPERHMNETIKQGSSVLITDVNINLCEACANVKYPSENQSSFLENYIFLSYCKVQDRLVPIFHFPFNLDAWFDQSLEWSQNSKPQCQRFSIGPFGGWKLPNNTAATEKRQRIVFHPLSLFRCKLLILRCLHMHIRKQIHIRLQIHDKNMQICLVAEISHTNSTPSKG